VQISKRQLDKDFENKIKDILAQVISDINNKDQAKDFLTDFLSETEFMALSKRLAVILYLDQKRSYEEIKDEIKVSSATIATTQSLLEKQSQGVILALKLVKAEEWATKWAGKITGIFGKK
jgi:uncharacterized protein YerC